MAQSQKPERFLAPIIVSVWVMSLTAIGYVIASGLRLSDLSTTGAREFFSAMGMHANDLGRLYAIAYALLQHNGVRPQYRWQPTAWLPVFRTSMPFGFTLIGLLVLDRLPMACVALLNDAASTGRTFIAAGLMVFPPFAWLPSSPELCQLAAERSFNICQYGGITAQHTVLAADP